MAKEIYLGIAIHNHQPVGNFPWVFDQACREAYLPLLELLQQHPGVRLSLHYTGSLLDWVRSNRPELMAAVKALVGRGQIEVMSGGYSEPILAMIPDADKLGQIDKLSRHVADEFGYQATGMWLAERVWEPHLPRYLAQAGMQWTVLDDTHFKAVGIGDADLFGYYITEELGASLKVYGSSKELRYLIPWAASAHKVIDYLRSEASETPGRIAVFGDDGEKLGAWPGTYDWCWEKGWLEEFFSALEKNSDWLHTIPLGEHARRFAALGRVYLPTSSYAEMLEWSLPAAEGQALQAAAEALQGERWAEARRFLRAGFWRNFLVKYPEVNNLHKKMLLVSEKVHSLPAVQERPGGAARGARLPQGQPPAAARQDILDALWDGQCNCPYWHGVFGGVYLTDVRTAVFNKLVQAEAMADRVSHGDAAWLHVENSDFDIDGRGELLVSGDRQNLYLDPADGGSLFEWDWRPRAFNLLNTLSRRPEAYHRAIAEQERKRAEAPATGEAPATPRLDLQRYLRYDWYRRSTLRDHFLLPNSTLQGFHAMEYGEQGDFVNQAYTAQWTQKSGSVMVSLWRDGHVWLDNLHAPLRVEKVIAVGQGADGFAVQYRLTNTGGAVFRSVFAVESNINLLGGNPAAYYEIPGRTLANARLDSMEETPAVGGVRLVNLELGISVGMAWERPADLWRLPVETISQAVDSFDKTYQSSCLLPHWQIDLQPGEVWELSLTYTVE